MTLRATTTARIGAAIATIALAAACTNGEAEGPPGVGAPVADGGVDVEDAGSRQSSDGGASEDDAAPLDDAGPTGTDAGPGGSDAGTPEPDAGPARVTFADLHGMLEERCTLCHHVGDMGIMPLFEGEVEEVRTGLVDVPSEAIPSMLLVHPGSPDDSWLLHKVAGTHLEVCEDLGVGSDTCGGRMPRGTSEVLTADQIEQVRIWIEDGAR